MITQITQIGELDPVHLHMILSSHATTLADLVAQFPERYRDTVTLISAELPLEGFKFLMFFTGLLALFASISSHYLMRDDSRS